MSNKIIKYTLQQSGKEVQEILDRDEVLTEEEYDNLVSLGQIDEKKIYFIYEEDL